jgi:hypothetical protein
MVSLLHKDMHKLGFKNKLIQYHCINHQQNLNGKPLGFKQFMTDAVSVVNFIRSYGLNHRQFKVYLDEIKSEYCDNVYYCEVRLLSKGKVLQCILSLLEEITVFFIEGHPLILKTQVGLCAPLDWKLSESQSQSGHGGSEKHSYLCQDSDSGCPANLDLR